MNRIIKLLQKDARMKVSDIAAATGFTDIEVKEYIAKLEKDGIILGYSPIINWEKLEKSHVSALVEVKFSLSHSVGFEELCTTIAAMDEVDGVSLMSGGYDLMVKISGKSIQEIAFFVNERLSSMENVSSTTTHFELKTYKSNGRLIVGDKRDKREVMI